MALLPTSIPRLLVLFLLFIFLPGMILSWFNIKTIIEQKEITEKELLDEQIQLTNHLQSRMEEFIVDYIQEFQNYIDTIQFNSSAPLSIFDSLTFVDQAILYEKGELLWPCFYPRNSQSDASRSQRFRRYFSQAEKAEFSDGHLQTAFATYQLALDASETDYEKGCAINALARACIKLNRLKPAKDYYLALLKYYSSEVDENALPFSYYAIHQAIHLSKKTGDDSLLLHVIDLLYHNKIPLTAHFHFLFNELKTSIDLSDINNFALAKKLTSIEKTLSFVINHATNTIDILENLSSNDVRPCYFSFYLLKGFQQEHPYVLLMTELPDKKMAGFYVHLDYFKESILAEMPTVPLKFKQKCALLLPNDTLKTDHEHVFMKSVDAIIPASTISLRPVDENIILKYSTQRQFVYGAAVLALFTGLLFGYILISRDFKREKKVAELRNDFVSNVTHELKTPLTSIRALAETLKFGRYRSKKEQQDYLDIIVNESERLTRLINNVLDFSRIEKGSKQYNIVKANITEIVQSAINIMKSSADEKVYKIISKIEANIIIFADPDAIKQAVLNLLSNAFKYSKQQKEVVVEVQCYETKDAVKISVTDQGIGIAKSEIPLIFNKFYRCSHDRHMHKTGTGLGLSLVKHIMDEHQGKIDVKSQLGIGSTFTLVLPRIECQ
ncbi:hypothetical protein EH223_07675 [candidate division KSB1 bacterium]|nr:hypothetical protein [candidate division KSB1 bacterium]RQW04421.1 MAG: hypothetical protein EH223_07675 [candidate division KSB1 bacterium]